MEQFLGMLTTLLEIRYNQSDLAVVIGPFLVYLALAAKDHNCFQACHVVNLGHKYLTEGAGCDQHRLDRVVEFLDCLIHISEVFERIIL